MGRCSSMTGRLLRASFSLTIVLVALLALLPARRLITVETGAPDNQAHYAQDTSDSIAFVNCVDAPPFSRETVELVPDAAAPYAESFVVSSYSYRGPPVSS